jgi:hypothetical protein
MDKKAVYTRVFLKSAELPTDEDTVKEKKIEWWFNIRNKDAGGLRLTEAGLEFLTSNSSLKTYEVQLPPEISITPQVLVWLDKFITCPYYFNKKKIIVTEEKSAFELYLFSGDIRKLGYTKAMAKRLQSEIEAE